MAVCAASMRVQLRARHQNLSQVRGTAARAVRRSALSVRAQKDDVGVVYVGNGKFVKEDAQGIQSGTGKGDVGPLMGMTGGWAGGEKALDAFKTELKSAPMQAEFTDPAEAKKKVVYNAKTGQVVDPDFSKDFGSLAGGWPGGEKGVAMFVETGEVIENKKAPTVGWGPAVFTMALVGAFGYWVYSNDPLVEVTAEDGTVQMVKSMSVKDTTPPPPLTAVAQKVAPYAAAAVGVGAGGLLLTVAAKKGLAKAGEAAVKGGRVAALGLVAGAIGTHILGLW